MKRGHSLLELMLCVVIILILSGLSFRGLWGVIINTKKAQNELLYNDRLTPRENMYDRRGHIIQPNKPMYVNGAVMLDIDGNIITRERFLSGVRPPETN